MIKPKKYRAKVLTMVLHNENGEDVPQYQTVEGYLAPVSLSSKDGEDKVNIVWGLYSDIPYFDKCAFMGMGKSIYQPMVYTGFTDLEEIQDE